MMFKTGSLDVTSEIRSVPLGEKRKKGRPKKIQHCLLMSPPLPNRAVTDTLTEASDDGNMEEVSVDEIIQETTDNGNMNPDEVIDLGVKSRKRKQPGLGAYKPPKKKPRLPVPIDESSSVHIPRRRKELPSSSSSKPASAAKTSSTKSKASTRTCSPTSEYAKPLPRNCKKKIGSCKHEIVFNIHYDHNEWNLYAERVRAAKSLTEIDPNYVA